ncbi:MAG: signal recognition particle-docking protein FtsY [Methylococcaceae bacterium]|jgi:fused signal recognition particle receptor
MFRKITLFSLMLAVITSILVGYMGMPVTQWGQWFDVNLLSIVNGMQLGLMGLLVMPVILVWRDRQRTPVIISLSVIWLFLALEFMLHNNGIIALKQPVFAATDRLLAMFVFWILYSLYLRTDSAAIKDTQSTVSRVWVCLAMFVLYVQIKLGVWTSVNHAGSVCQGFPLCNGQWWPQADYLALFNLGELIQNTLKGVTTDLSYTAQIAINYSHRIGAIVTFMLLTLVGFKAMSGAANRKMSRAGLILSALLFIQTALGVLGFKLMPSHWVALAHHLVAEIMMLPLLAIYFYSRRKFTYVPLADQAFDVQSEGAIDTALLDQGDRESEPESLYLRLQSQLKRTRSGLGELVANLALGQKGIDDDVLEDLEANLIMADLGINVTQQIINHLTQQLDRQQLRDPVQVTAALKEELLNILNPCSHVLQIPKQATPFVILVVGVNGAGKTTTIGKLAKRLQMQGHSVMLAAGDTFRAAAVEQLQTWGERNAIPVVAQHTGADSASVIYDAVQSAQAKGIDVLIADTAGRLHTKSNLMDELKKVTRIMAKLDANAPHEVLLVLDAGTGQNALSQAKQFNETVPLTGLVLTKLDGTAKGGVIFALARQMGIPIRFIGIGEGIDDLQDFDAKMFVDALFTQDN